MRGRDRPMMACGHRANATWYQGGEYAGPSCAICAGIDPRATVIATDPPDLTVRTARCTYYGRPARSRSREGPCNGTWATRDEPCLCERPSAEPLAFFHHQPDQPYDRYFCGCWGWD